MEVDKVGCLLFPDEVENHCMECKRVHDWDKCMSIRNLLRSWKAGIVALQETNWNRFLGALCEVCRMANTLIGVNWILGGLLVPFF